MKGRYNPEVPDMYHEQYRKHLNDSYSLNCCGSDPRYVGVKIDYAFYGRGPKPHHKAAPQCGTGDCHINLPPHRRTLFFWRIETGVH